MTRRQLLAKLRECAELDKRDPEAAHAYADEALMAYIDDPDIRELYDSLTRWCA